MAGLLKTPPGRLSEAHEGILIRHLHRWAREPFSRSSANCALSVLDYIEEVRGQRADPDPRQLGLFSRAALWGSEQVFVDYARGVLEQLGCSQSDQPQRGDVGLLSGIAETLTCGICLGDSWAVRGKREAIVLPASFTVAWRVSCPRR